MASDNESSQTPIVIRESKALVILVALLWGTDVAIVVVCLLVPWTGVEALVALLVGFFLAGLLTLVDLLNRRTTIDPARDTIEKTNLFGVTTARPLSDVRRLKERSDQVIVQDSRGQTLACFEYNMNSSADAIEFLMRHLIDRDLFEITLPHVAVEGRRDPAEMFLTTRDVSLRRDGRTQRQWRYQDVRRVYGDGSFASPALRNFSLVMELRDGTSYRLLAPISHFLVPFLIDRGVDVDVLQDGGRGATSEPETSSSDGMLRSWFAAGICFAVTDVLVLAVDFSFDVRSIDLFASPYRIVWAVLAVVFIIGCIKAFGGSETGRLVAVCSAAAFSALALFSLVLPGGWSVPLALCVLNGFGWLFVCFLLVRRARNGAMAASGVPPEAPLDLPRKKTRKILLIVGVCLVLVAVFGLVVNLLGHPFFEAYDAPGVEAFARDFSDDTPTEVRVYTSSMSGDALYVVRDPEAIVDLFESMQQIRVGATERDRNIPTDGTYSTITYVMSDGTTYSFWFYGEWVRLPDSRGDVAGGGLYTISSDDSFWKELESLETIDYLVAPVYESQ